MNAFQVGTRNRLSLSARRKQPITQRESRQTGKRWLRFELQQSAACVLGRKSAVYR